MLNIGDTVFLEMKYSDERVQYKCRVVERKGNYLFIDYPINQKTNKTAFFVDGTELKASFYGKDTAIYMFETQIVGRKKINIPMLIINFPGNDKLVRIQRREFVRIDTTVDVAIHPVNGDFTPFTTVTVDISAGGAAILLPPKHRLKQNTELMCYLVLPLSNGEYFYIITSASVIRVIPGVSGSRDKAPLKFVDLTENQIQQITRFCFDRQLSERRSLG